MSPLVRQPLTVEHALLGFLRERPMHGYEIHHLMIDPAGLGLVWQVKQSHLYAMLDKLENDGCIAGRQETQHMRPPRRVFRLTSAGRRAFQAWLSRPVSHGREVRLEFMAKVYFAQREGPERVAGLLQLQRQVCGAWRATLETQSTTARAGPDYERLVRQFRLGQIEAMIAWLDQCAESLPAPDHGT
jgi:DNA-binding PadR family transcriptional regulator